MKNNRYFELKLNSVIKSNLMESAMDWQQSHGCYPNVGEFSNLLNETLGINAFLEEILQNTEELNESHISAFSTILQIILEETDWDILGVPEGASAEEIRRAYRTKARGAHPDTGGTAEAFQKLKDAYDRLKSGTPASPPPGGGPKSSTPPPPPPPPGGGPKSSTPPPPPPPPGGGPKPAPAPSPAPSSGKLMNVLKYVGGSLPIMAGAMEGQSAFKYGAQQLGAGEAATTGAEIAGAYEGERLAIKGFDWLKKMFGKAPTKFKASPASSAGVVLGSKISDDEVMSPLGALGGGLAGGMLSQTKAGRAVTKAAETGAEKVLGKTVAKKIPLVSVAAGLGLGVDRLLRGDASGAVGEVASGVLGTIPGLGTAGSLGIDTALAARDIQRETEAQKTAEEEARKQREQEAINLSRQKQFKRDTELMQQRYMREEHNLTNLVEYNTLLEQYGRLAVGLGRAAPEALETATKYAAKYTEPALKYAEPAVDVLRKAFADTFEKWFSKAPEVAKEIEAVKTTTEIPEISPIQTKETKPVEIPKETPVEVPTVSPLKTTFKTPTEADLTKAAKDLVQGTDTDVAADLATKTQTALQTKTQTQPQTDLATKTQTELQTKTQTKTQPQTKTQTALKLALDLLTATQPVVKTQTALQTRTQLQTQTALKTNTQLSGAPKSIEGVTPKVSVRTPSRTGTRSTKLAPDEPTEKGLKSVKPGPEEMLPPGTPMTDVRYPALRAASYGVLPIYEGIYNPKSSVQNKAKKQKYKIVVVLDGGKKVEIFASTLRGVKRAIYGKKNFRIYDSKGSDISGYFKRQQRKTSDYMRGKR
jgi:hypothetical protein